ncbi:MAG: response regulator [Candidatus Riflebacteria bacterium]|nr:response regulator [Candidatus Riflebacteria bacterium]
MPLRKPGILIVDDVPENIEVLGTILENDYTVFMALSGKEALRIANENLEIQMVLLDVMMPIQDGFEVCRQLKASPITRNIPVIFITSMNEDRNETMGFSVGCADYISKPVNPRTVLARVKAHLAMHNQAQFLEKIVQERTLELLQTRDIAIFTLASLAEMRDDETGDHIKRTQHYMRALCEQLIETFPDYKRILDEETIDLLYKSAPLHDAGKVGIRDSILLKPGKLTPEEFEIMKGHVRIGRDAITRGAREMGLDHPPSFLKVARDIAYSHHEKWDGSGYPEKLSGTSIPLAGRLMAICDVYDALISKRAYKPPFPHKTAVQIIRDGKGSHFDPQLNDVFMSIQDVFFKIALKHTTLPEEKESLLKNS